jgi:hypothetical protein
MATTAGTAEDEHQAVDQQQECEGRMSDDPRRLTTEEQRERLYAARYRGSMCAACGRTLDPGEPVYWEQFTVGRVGGWS